MRIGVPLEIKDGEARVALRPAEVAVLAADGHDLRVESQAGARVGHADAAYREAGARIVGAGAAWDAELVVKVKEVQEAELARLRAEQAIFGFHQLANEPERTRALAARRITAIAFEMVRTADGRYPLLAPMSAMSGRMAIAIATRVLGKTPARVLVLGGGSAGVEAARAAAEAGARVTLLTRSSASREAARQELGTAADVALASPEAIEHHALEAELVVGAAAIAGAPTPKLLTRALVARMRRGAMIVDIAIDGGGVAETSRMTSHADPTYVEEGVIHYCVPNIPAAQPRAATDALAAAVLPFARELASRGIARAVRENPALANAVVLWRGRATHAGIAREAQLPYTALTMAQTP